ncbi:MAG: hypothetical protein K2N89_14260 [Lachnospiraceae bacterium]|nr:hypothetical protein [Lachnospiraceae bacterium]
MVKKKLVAACLLAFACSMAGCEKTEENATDSTLDFTQNLLSEGESTEATEGDTQEADVRTLAPSKEQVINMREVCLAGMTDEEVDRLCENIKVANQTLENAYFYDNLFERLSDSDNLYWNYIDEKGDIIIGYVLEEGLQYDADSGLTYQEYAKEHGQPITEYNRFDAQNFMDLMTEMRDSLNADMLKPDFDALISNMEMAGTTHDVKYIEEIFYILHDMDYYLLRYAPEDLGAYVTDRGMISKYYGALQVYEKEMDNGSSR